ncbi:MAG TPA: hypothetical protein DHW64_03510 [Chitinophagaceae bacterium]|jgi:hypothetical protein|nr:hypothetical protein [Chitinophagaceae bacterium]
MNPPNFQLPDFVLSDLYKTQLVVINESTIESNLPQKKQSEAPVKPEFLGDNRKNICILVKDEQAVYLNDNSLQFLSAILAACKLNLGDVAIVNFRNTGSDFAALKSWLQPRYLLVFDIPAAALQLPFDLPNYQVQAYDQCSMLFAPSLSLMTDESREAKLEKSKLWLSLKNMFNI